MHTRALHTLLKKAVIGRIWSSKASKLLNLGFPPLEEEAEWLIVISIATQQDEEKNSHPELIKCQSPSALQGLFAVYTGLSPVRWPQPVQDAAMPHPANVGKVSHC